MASHRGQVHGAPGAHLVLAIAVGLACRRPGPTSRLACLPAGLSRTYCAVGWQEFDPLGFLELLQALVTASRRRGPRFGVASQGLALVVP